MIRGKLWQFAGVVCVLGAAGTGQAATPNMNEGLWEITVRMEMPGMPGGMPPQTIRQCITKKDLDDPRKTTPNAGPSDNRCEITDYKSQGNTATWKMACKSPQEMTGVGSATYNRTSYIGTNKMTMKEGGQVMNMNMTYSGRHVGECKR